MSPANRARYFNDAVYQVTQLNEGLYRNDPGYMNSGQIDAVNKEIARLLKELVDKKPTDGFHDEAVAYVERMLELRYARSQLKKAAKKGAAVGKKDMREVARALEKFAKDWAEKD